MTATLGGVALPGVYVQETDRRVLGGEVRRALDGTPHRGPVKTIRTWVVDTRPMERAQFDAIMDMLDTVAGGQVLWVPGDGTPPTYVYVIEASDTRERIPDGELNAMRSVRLILEEA